MNEAQRLLLLLVFFYLKNGKNKNFNEIQWRCQFNSFYTLWLCQRFNEQTISFINMYCVRTDVAAVARNVTFIKVIGVIHIFGWLISHKNWKIDKNVYMTVRKNRNDLLTTVCTFALVHAFYLLFQYLSISFSPLSFVVLARHYVCFKRMVRIDEQCSQECSIRNITYSFLFILRLNFAFNQMSL